MKAFEFNLNFVLSSLYFLFSFSVILFLVSGSMLILGNIWYKVLHKILWYSYIHYSEYYLFLWKTVQNIFKGNISQLHKEQQWYKMIKSNVLTFTILSKVFLPKVLLYGQARGQYPRAAGGKGGGGRRCLFWSYTLKYRPEELFVSSFLCRKTVPQHNFWFQKVAQLVAQAFKQLTQRRRLTTKSRYHP